MSAGGFANNKQTEQMKTTQLSLVAVLVLGSLVTFAPMTQAQDKKDEQKEQKPEAPPGERKRPSPQDRLQQISEALKLTDEQKEKLKPIFKEEGEKLKALREDTSIPQEEKRGKARAIMEAGAAKIKPILTAEQLTKWEEMRAEAQKKRKQKQQ